MTTSEMTTVGTGERVGTSQGNSTGAVIVAALGIVVAVVGAFVLNDNNLYHWWAVAALGVIAIALAVKEKSTKLVLLGAFVVVLPAILMFGSWLVYTLMHM